jgi:hypothetical protein
MHKKMIDWELKMDNIIHMIENNSLELVSSWFMYIDNNLKFLNYLFICI